MVYSAHISIYIPEIIETGRLADVVVVVVFFLSISL